MRSTPLFLLKRKSDIHRCLQKTLKICILGAAPLCWVLGNFMVQIFVVLGHCGEMIVTWLHQHLPERAGKVLARIRDIRGGKLNDPNFHSRMEGQGIFAQQMHGLFAIACRKAGIPDSSPRINTQAFRRPGGQGSLFQGMGSK